MLHRSVIHRLVWGLLTAGTALWLAACTGSTGPAGPAGAAGPPGPITSGPVTAVQLKITSVSLGSTSTVDFTATNQNGVGYVGLPASTLEVTIAKLVPGTNGDADHWQSYINATDTPTGVGPGTTPTIVATTDSGGSLVDHQDGTYTYTFGTDIANVTQPETVSYDPTLTTRVAIAVRWENAGMANLPTNNAIYDFQPSTGATTGILEHNVVDTASCDACHEHLSAHGGPRQDVRLCVTCHNPGSTEANSGNTLDFEVMIHKIHDGANLPSVVAGTPYIIYGYQNSVNNFSTVVFPQNIENCATCHNVNDSNTPQADLAFNQPTMQACGACHDNVDFAAGMAGGHPGGVETDNSECSVCHKANSVAGSVQQSHVIPSKVAAANFRYNILSVAGAAPGDYPVVTFSITNPNNNNAPYNLSTDPAFTASGGVSRIYLDLSWSASPSGSGPSYPNFGSGSYPGQPVSINVLPSDNPNGNPDVAPSGSGVYTVTSPVALPSYASGLLTVGIEGHPAADFSTTGSYTDEVPVTSAVAYFSIPSGAAATAPTLPVALANCQKCHGTNDGLSLHGSNRTDNLHLCVICHNPDATDISQRPVDPDGTPNGINTAAIDGLEQRPINFVRLIHSIHAAAFRTSKFVVYGFGGSPHDFSTVRFPGVLQDCNQCHQNNSYEPPLPAGVLGTTIDTHATEIASGTGKTISPLSALEDPTGYSRISPTAAACSACHDDPTSMAHMEQNGAAFDATETQIIGGYVETCAICHGAGGVADVAVEHGLN